jgi:uncharacterized protein DUF3617
MIRRVTFAFVFLGSVSLLAAAEPPKVMGKLWEVTTQMSMEGAPIALPVQKAKVCVGSDQYPVGADDQHKCTNSGFKKEGTKITWKTVCEGGMTGDGEITYSDADNYSGTLKFTSPQGSMTTKLTGKNLGTACEVKK